MTPQDIREKTFEKAMFGGYEMGGVDDFLEEAAVELDALQKENATLKAKMKVLVDKIEEYRGGEDAMRQTIMAAQRFASQIEGEARAHAEKVKGEADAAAARALAAIKGETDAEQARLTAAKTSFARFVEEARLMCSKQLDYLGRVTVPGVQAPAPARESSVDDAVRSIEASVARIPDEPAPRIDISPAMKEPAPGSALSPDDVTRMFNMGGQS